jgi:2-hydroxychromene-2-carboxylate isomerase
VAGLVEFFFDYVSPYAYLANKQLAELQVPIGMRPIAILEVMKLVNNQPSPRCPPKARYAALDAKRWADRELSHRASKGCLWLQPREPKSLKLQRLARAPQAEEASKNR